MHAVILAAGCGERMHPLTDHTPKPLLEVGGKPLIVYHVERLVAAGHCDIVVNHAHLGYRIEAALGDGSSWGARIRYSPEGKALETRRGIYNALPLLAPGPFLVVNGDIWTDMDFGPLQLEDGLLAHLVLVDNPLHNPEGDFALDRGRLSAHGSPRHTYSGVGLYHPDLFRDCSPGAFPLAPLLRAAMGHALISGWHYRGRWLDIGTPERLQTLDRMLLKGSETT